MDVLYEFLHDGLNSMIERRDEHLADKGGRGRLYAWYWGHWGRAAVNFYEVSGEQRFLDLIVNTYRRLLAERDDTLNLVDDERGWIVPAWGTLYKDGTRSNEITTAGLITLPICHFLNLADRNELVRQNYADAIRDFREAALETLSAFEDEIRQSPAGGGSFFFHLTDGIVEPLNHSHMFGAAVAHCAASIPREEFSRIVRGLAGYFSKAIVRNNNGSYSWPMHPLQPT